MVLNYKMKSEQDVLDAKKINKLTNSVYNVPQSTLERTVNQVRKNENTVQNFDSFSYEKNKYLSSV